MPTHVTPTPDTPTQIKASRYAFFALALLLVVLVAGLGGTSFQRKIVGFQPLGLEVEQHQGTWWVTAVVDPAVGLEVGDAIVLAAGERPLDDRSLRELLTTGASAELLVRRGETLTPITYRRPDVQINAPYLILTAIGILYLLIGLYTLAKDAKQPARLFFLWCLTSAALDILSPILPPADRTDELIYLADLLARILLPALTLHLFLVFPTPLLRRRVGLAALYLPSAVLAAFHADQIFWNGLWSGPPSARKLLWVDRLELYLLVLFSLAALGALLARLSGRRTWEERRQVQWIFFGMAGGWLPFFALYVLPLALRFDARFTWWPEWTTSLAVLPLVLVPMTFAWAILRYKLLDLETILRESVTYSLTGLVGIFGFLVIHQGIQRGVAEDLSLLRNLLTFSAGLAIAGVLVPTKAAIAGGIDRLQHRGTTAQRRALARLGQELLFERDLARLAETLGDRLAEGLMTHVQLYLSRGDILVPVPPRDNRDLPENLPFGALGEEIWRRDVIGLSAVELPGAGASVQQRLFAAGYRYAFPIRVRGHRVGIALVTYKFQHEPLVSEDLDLIRTLLDQAGLAIENAQLLSEVHHQLCEVGRLERHNQGIIDSSPAGIAVLAEGRRIQSANHAFAAILGREGEDLTGLAVADLLPVLPLPSPHDGLVEIGYCEMSGEERYLQLNVAHYPQAGGGELEILVIQDRSEQHALETSLKEKERLASLGMLAAGVAHEVNTPLTGISSYAQILLEDLDADDPHRELLKKMERQTFRAAQIVNNLLEFARNRHDEFVPVDLGAVLGEAVSLLAERAAEQSVEIVWTRPDTPLVTLGSEGELHQVATNLLVNALDAMKNVSPGERRLEIHSATDGDRILLRVADRGPGIPPERLDRIFQPFFSSKLGKGGTGLGLALVENIVRRHRGTIRVDNRGDGGCVFTVDLPRHAA